MYRERERERESAYNIVAFSCMCDCCCFVAFVRYMYLYGLCCVCVCVFRCVCVCVCLCVCVSEARKGGPTAAVLLRLPETRSECTSHTVDFQHFIVFSSSQTFIRPRPWHIEIRHRVKQTSTVNLIGFETLKLKIPRLKLWKPTAPCPSPCLVPCCRVRSMYYYHYY